MICPMRRAARTKLESLCLARVPTPEQKHAAYDAFLTLMAHVENARVEIRIGKALVVREPR
ncbi:hypothetical protein B0G84_5026 [Paraburkholderia sp. BL8N3]|nr:hypothetical protein B0G84_5026 [Paraburkholderia sp. BL8N3]